MMSDNNDTDIEKTEMGLSGKSEESIRVLVRIRPLNNEEMNHSGNNSSVTSYDTKSLTLRNPESKKQFQCSFDAVLGPTSTQEDVYSSIQVCTNSVKDGFNRY
jgi:hypothetical protein